MGDSRLEPVALSDDERRTLENWVKRRSTAQDLALASGHYTHGPETELFERELAAFLGVPDVVAVSFGTAALHIALLAAGIGPGDEAVVPSFTFCATVQAVLACGATPRLAEVDPATSCVTPGDARVITRRAFVPRSKPDPGQPETGIHLGRGVLNPC